MKRGASEYITKPFEWEELEEKIRTVGGKKRSKPTRPSIGIRFNWRITRYETAKKSD